MPSRTLTMAPWADFAFLQHQLDRLAQDAFGMRSQTSVATLPVFLEQGAERAMNGLHGKD